MREFIFRGKRKDNGEWVEGGGIDANFGEAYILRGWEDGSTGTVDVDSVEVIPETVGQYTGLTDKHGKTIFEGDIIKSYLYVFIVAYGKCGGCANTDDYGYIGFHLEPADKNTKLHMSYGLRDDICYFTEAEVIGNIHDDHELLEVEQ